MARAPKAAPPRPLAGRELVVVAAHPVLTGAWYFAEDWAQRKRAAERMGRVFPYVPASQPDGSPVMQAHPTEDGAVGRVWMYRPEMEGHAQ